MRIAIISDTHGNLTSTAAVLDILAQERPDQIVCLGDVAIFGPQPREVLAAVRSLDCPVVLGNTDAWALDPVPDPEQDEQTALFNAVEGWSAAQLTESDKTFIRSFQPVVRIELDREQTLLCYHGSPRSFHEGIASSTPEETLDEIFADHGALICAGGHTHTQMVRRHGRRLIINPGSVGLPFEILPDESARNPPWAEFAVLDYRSPADVHVELRRVPVNVQAIVEAAHRSGMAMAGRWAADWSG